MPTGLALGIACVIGPCLATPFSPVVHYRDSRGIWVCREMTMMGMMMMVVLLIITMACSTFPVLGVILFCTCLHTSSCYYVLRTYSIWRISSRTLINFSISNPNLSSGKVERIPTQTSFLFTTTDWQINRRRKALNKLMSCNEQCRIGFASYRRRRVYPERVWPEKSTRRVDPLCASISIELGRSTACFV